MPHQHGTKEEFPALIRVLSETLLVLTDKSNQSNARNRGVNKRASDYPFLAKLVFGIDPGTFYPLVTAWMHVNQCAAVLQRLRPQLLN